MKTKILMILLLVVSLILGIITAFMYDLSNIFSWMFLYNLSGLLMLIFSIAALYYSYTLGTSRRVILFSVLAPFLYFILNSFVIRPIILYSNLTIWTWVVNLIWIIGFGITLMVYFVNFKYSKSNVFLVLVVFSMLGAMIPFSSIIGGLNSIANSMIFYRTPKAILLVVAILYDKRIRMKLFREDGPSIGVKEII